MSVSFDRAPFLETERSALVTMVFFTREDRVPSSESYCCVLVPRWFSITSRASRSSSCSFYTFCFSALASAMTFRFLAPCDLPFAEPREVVACSSCFASCFFFFCFWVFPCFSCSTFTSSAARAVASVSSRFCISACCAATCVACCCVNTCRTCRS